MTSAKDALRMTLSARRDPSSAQATLRTIYEPERYSRKLVRCWPILQGWKARDKRVEPQRLAVQVITRGPIVGSDGTSSVIITTAVEVEDGG